MNTEHFYFYHALWSECDIYFELKEPRFLQWLEREVLQIRETDNAVV